MEVDHVPYIFGSFSRRRHSQNLSRKQSMDMPRISHTHTHSQPHVPRKKDPEIAVQRTRSYFQQTPLEEDHKYICSICRKVFVEPRVLSCLHTFCTSCLQNIDQKETWNVSFSTEVNGKAGPRNSGGSGYDSGDRAESSPEDPNVSPDNQSYLTCPLCNTRTVLNRKGILGLPPNYVLQHRIVLATLNSEATKLLCDLCTSDITATYRCSECLINLCDACTEAHRRHRIVSRHELLAIRDVRQKGLMKIHRQIMCQAHPDQQLSAYCTTCLQVVCRECIETSHASHACETASRAAISRASRVTHALQKARQIVEKASAVNHTLKMTNSSVEGQCTRVQEEIETFMETYREALEEHRTSLINQVSQVRDEKLQLLTSQQQDLEKRIQDAQNTVLFTEELLKEGSEVEILTFITVILKKLELCNKMETEDLIVPKICQSLHFLPSEMVENSTGTPLYGVVTTQTVAPNQCTLHREGLENLRVHRKAEILLETNDSSGNQVSYGGESVMAELWYRDAGTSCRSLAVHITDKRDGTYIISFTPDTPGKLSLAVSVKGQHIQDSPFPVFVRNVRPHRGTYHCCRFCSSGGNKEASCACGGRMPGGYKGCGHGHEGHPGRRHWSCCGNVLENSECGRANSTCYQFTL